MGCTDRCIGCHSKCERYTEYSLLVNMERQAKIKVAETNKVHNNYHFEKVEKVRRRH
jgi:hypothetical protein